MRSPRGGLQQLVFLAHQQRSDLACKDHEVFILEEAAQEVSAICIVVKFPQMHELVQLTGV